MRERGDLQCLHEPFLHYYYLQKTKKKLAHFEDEADHPVSYDDTRNWILDMAEKGPVFAKDMSYYVIPEILEDQEFCARIRHCFLIRHPLKSILSYYKLDPGLSLEEIGLQAQWLHYQGIEKLGFEKPVVLEAEMIQADTKSTMRQFWQALGLDYSDKAFDWSNESTPQDWQYVRGWHVNASSSAGIKPMIADDETNARAAFEAAAQQAPQLNDYLQHHLPCYQSLKQRSLTAGV